MKKFPKGVWNILNKRFYKPCQLRFWAILNLAGHDLQDSAIMSQFQMLVTCCNLLGMSLLCPFSLFCADDICIGMSTACLSSLTAHSLTM